MMIVEPIVIWISSRQLEPRVIVLWDGSESMSLVDRAGDRKAVVAEIDDSKAFASIRSAHDVAEFLFSDSVVTKPTRLSFEGPATALGDAITRFRRNPDDQPIGAMIVISDGQTNQGEDPLGASYRTEFPVFTIGVGDPTPPRDIILRQIVAQKVAFAGRPFPIIATLSANGYSGLETSVSLFSGDKKIDEKRIILPGNGELLDVDFEVLQETEGEIVFRTAVPLSPEELSANNNSRSVRVKVLPTQRSILVIGSRPNWEFTFLTRNLKADPDIVVKTAFLGQSAPAGEIPLPKTLEDFKAFDAIYIVDALNQLDGMNLGPVLYDYVASGGALGIHLLGEIIINRSSANIWSKLFPFIYSSGSHVWMEDNFVPELSVRGLVHPITRGSDEGAFQTDNYQRIPPLSGFTMVTGSPAGSEVLLSHPKMADVPILASREVGKGRVLLINGAGLWRWAFIPFGFGGNSDLYRGLVSRGSGWLLAAGEGNDFIVETDKPVYRSGEKLITTAKLRDQSNLPLSGARITAKFARTDSLGDSLIIILEDRGEGLYSSELPGFDVGRWSLTATAQLKEQTIGSATYSFLVEPYSIELENVQLNSVALQSIAEATGGRYFRAGELDSLPDLIQTPKVLRRERKEKAIWDNPLLLLIFVLALCGEWILRKKWDLP